MIIGIITLASIIFFAILFYLLVNFVIKYRKNKFLYKSSFKGVKSFSFSMVILVIFYMVSFGYVFGSFTALSTYNKSLSEFNEDLNYNMFLSNTNNGIYEGDWESSRYLTEAYWNDFVDESLFPYQESATWNDFVEAMLSSDSSMYQNGEFYNGSVTEPIYGLYTPFSFISESEEVYMLLSIWNEIYDYNVTQTSNPQFYFRFTQYFKATVNLRQPNNSFLDNRSMIFLNLGDYNAYTNTYYDSYNEMIEDDSALQKTSTTDGDSYYVSTYNFTEFAQKPNGQYYTADDLLSVNNHHGNNIKDDKVIEVAISEPFAELNNIVLGQEYDLNLSSKSGNNYNYTFMPIATFEDVYSASDDYWNGTILVNSLDYDRLMYGDNPILTPQDNENGINERIPTYSYNFNPSSYVLFQTDEYRDNFQLKNLTSAVAYKNLENDYLFDYVRLLNQRLFYDLFGTDNPDDLTPIQLNDFENSFQFDFGVNSIHEDAFASNYYNKNASAAMNFYIIYLINIIIIALLFLIVIFIMYSIISSRIKDNYKQFGVLKSFGYDTKSISISFLVFPIALILIANIFAIALTVVFYILSINNFVSVSAVAITSPSIGAFFFILFLSFAIIVSFAYLKIRRSLNKEEIILLNGKKVYQPNIVFREMSKIGDKFKSFEASYAFKNVFKSISKSSLIFFSTFASLFLVVLSLTITSFIKVNIEENFSGTSFDYYYRYNQSWSNYMDYSSISKEMVSIEGLNQMYEDRETSNDFQNVLDSQFLNGDYTFAFDQAIQDVNNAASYQEAYDQATYDIFSYLVSIPVVSRNNVDALSVTNRYDLFDYSYISPQISWNFHVLYADLYLMYINDPDQQTIMFDEGFATTDPSLGIPQHTPALKLDFLNQVIFEDPTQRWMVQQEETLAPILFSIENQDYYLDIEQIIFLILNNGPEFKAFYLNTYPYITFGKQLVDAENTATDASLLLDYSSSPTSTSSKEISTNISDNIGDVNTWWNLEAKRGPDPYDAFASETPNQDYIPIAIDEGTAKSFNVEVGDYMYVQYSNRFGRAEDVPVKVVSIYEKADYGIFTSQEFVQGYFGKNVATNSLMANNDNQFGYQYSYGFTQKQYEQMLTQLNSQDVYLINQNSDTSSYEFNGALRSDKSIKYDLPLIQRITEKGYKRVTIALLLSTVIILIIPIFMIIISIKETIDDNIQEVSMLKALGYNTNQTSRLILSPSLLIVFLAFICIIPVAFIFFAILTHLFLSLLALQFTFKMLWWNWLIVITIDALIMILLYVISFYFYYKLKSKQILKNIF